MIGTVESEAAHFPEQLRVGYLATLPKPLLATLTVVPGSISSSRPRRRTIGLKRAWLWPSSSSTAAISVGRESGLVRIRSPRGSD